MANKTSAGEQVVTMDRRRKDRRLIEATDTQVKEIVATDRQKNKVQRRRQIDPTTCERDYSMDEIEFMQAMDSYKRKNGRMFPTCSEILEVIRDLGYVRMSASAVLVPAVETDDN